MHSMTATAQKIWQRRTTLVLIKFFSVILLCYQMFISAGYASESEAMSDEIEPASAPEQELTLEQKLVPATPPVNSAKSLQFFSDPQSNPLEQQPIKKNNINAPELDNAPINNATPQISEPLKTADDDEPLNTLAPELKSDDATTDHHSEVTDASKVNDVDDETTDNAPQENIESVSQDDKNKQQQPIHLLGTTIPPGLSTRVAWRPGLSLKGLASQAPVLVVHGETEGPTLCITSAVHGDELNGIEVVRQVLHQLKAKKLSGTVIGVPIVNIQGFLRNSRYLVDRRDLNRFFPGSAKGSLASRIAHSFFTQVISNCSALVDIHTGSFYRDNIPQLRADLKNAGVVQLTEGFGSTLVLHSSGAGGTLRRAAVNINIPSVTLELGGPMILDEKAVEHGVEGIFNLLNALGMYSKASLWGTPKPVYYESLWIRAEQGGIFFSKVKLGDHINVGDLLGTITNPITNEQFLLTSQHTGEVVGLAHNQVVYPGFATTHLAIKSDEITNTEKEKINKAEQVEVDEE